MKAIMKHNTVSYCFFFVLTLLGCSQLPLANTSSVKEVPNHSFIIEAINLSENTGFLSTDEDELMILVIDDAKNVMAADTFTLTKEDSQYSLTIDPKYTKKCTFFLLELDEEHTPFELQAIIIDNLEELRNIPFTSPRDFIPYFKDDDLLMKYTLSLEETGTSIKKEYSTTYNGDFYHYSIFWKYREKK